MNKKEIEELVKEMLKEMLNNGLIQHNSSFFTSSILLVKKKDGFWRYCIYYRQLNDLTINNKFLIFIINDLMNELHGS